MGGRVVDRIVRQARDSGHIRGILQNPLQVLASLAARHRGQFFVIRASDIVQLKGKLKVLKAAESGGEVIDGVVGNRQRTVPARIGDGELIVRIQLFGGV